MPSKFPAYVYILIAAATASLVAIFANPGITEPYVEGEAYLQIAQGHPETTYNYYAGRILHPLTVRTLANVFPMDLHRAFYIVALISLLGFCVSVNLYLYRRGVHPALIVLLAGVPAMVILFRGYYFQDFFHAMLVAAFLLVYSCSAWAALPILFLLQLTRESTILLSAWVVVL